MVVFFTIEGGNISVIPEVLLIKEFKELWDRDKAVNKDSAYLDFAFIYHTMDLRSPYRSYTADERDDVVAKDIYGKKHKKDNLIEDARKKYIELNRSKSALLLEDTYNAVDKLREYFQEVSLTKKDKNGKPIYSSKDLVSNMKAISDVIKSLKSLEKEVEKEKIEEFAIRGGGEKGVFEDADAS